MKKMVVSLLVISSGFVQAELLPRLGGKAVYDTKSHLTWVADTNLAVSDPFGIGSSTSGAMGWFGANNFIAAMNSNNYLGFNDWRLPTALNSDGSGPCLPAQFNCDDSEFGNLFFNELGGVAHQSILTSSDPDVNLFTNLDAGLNGTATIYWTSTDLSTNTNAAWFFNFNIGDQGHQVKTGAAFTWAVRDGDVQTEVSIDIKPGSLPNSINLCSNGAVPVAILGSDTFNIYDVNTDTLRFAEASVKMVGRKDPYTLCNYEDTNGDGIVDLICHYIITDIATLDGASSTATLNGELNDDTPIEGTDSVNIVKDTCN